MEPPKRADKRRLTHVDRAGRPRMVDVSAKPPTARRAVAEAEVAMEQATISLIVDGGGAKGDVMTVAEIAGVMGAKRTAELIPLCHPIPLTDLVVEVKPDRSKGAVRHPRHGRHGGPDRRRDGGADGCLRGRPHGLRYGQGGRPGRGDPPRAGPREVGRAIG